MKLSLTSLALAGLLVAGSASAMITSAPVTGVVGLSGATVNYTIENGVVTLFGDVDSGIESALVQAHVAKFEGVEKVKNLITVN